MKAFDMEAFAKAISGEVFETAWNEIGFSGKKFVQTENAHFGSAEIEEWKLEQVEFRGCDQGETEEGIASYLFTYYIQVSGVSYIEQEDDQGGSIDVPYGKHTCSGFVEVNVTRDAEQEDNEYLDADMESVSLSEDSFEYEDSEYVVHCAECGRRIGYCWESFDLDYEGNPICDNCMVSNSKGFVCPQCKRKLPEFMRGSSDSYCRDCESRLDI